MERLRRNGDHSAIGGSDPKLGGGEHDLAPSEVELLAGALVRLGQRVRSGEASPAEARAVVEVGRALEIDLAAAAGWSPSLVLCALLTRPQALPVITALLADGGGAVENSQ